MSFLSFFLYLEANYFPGLSVSAVDEVVLLFAEGLICNQEQQVRTPRLINYVSDWLLSSLSYLHI